MLEIFLWRYQHLLLEMQSNAIILQTFLDNISKNWYSWNQIICSAMNKLSLFFWLYRLINEHWQLLEMGLWQPWILCQLLHIHYYKGTENRNEFNISNRDLEISQTGETFCFRSFRSYGALCQWKNLDWTNLFCFKRFWIEMLPFWTKFERV